MKKILSGKVQLLGNQDHQTIIFKIILKFEQMFIIFL